MAVKSFVSEVIDKEQLTHKVWRVRFSIPDGQQLNFLAGQFMSLMVAPNVRRSYSFVNSPSANQYMETLVDVSPNGPGSYFFVNTKVGQKVNVLAPLGIFVYKEHERPVHFYATGTGITPLFCMISHALIELGSRREILLRIGFRYENEVFYERRLADLAKKYKNFTYEIFVSRPDPGWTGRSGYINQDIGSDSHLDIDAYICGGTVMIAETTQKLLLAGISNDQIHHEKYY